MSEGDQTPPGRGLPDPERVVAPRAWGASPRRWIPGDTWAGASRVSSAPAARRSALTPLPEDDEPTSAPRRSAMSPVEDDGLDAVAPRRSALSPLPPDDSSAAKPRRSAFTPTEPDDEPVPRRSGWVEDDDEDDEPRLPSPRRSSEYTRAARAIQPALPELGPTPASAPSPVDAPSEAPAAVTDPASPVSPSVQPVLPDPAPSWPAGPGVSSTEQPRDVAPVTVVEAELSSIDPIPLPAAHETPAVTVTASTMAAAAGAVEVAAIPAIAEVPASLADRQELLAEEDAMVSEGGQAVEPERSDLGDDTATWLFGSALTEGDHSLYKRPAPGEPETEVDLTPIVIDDPEYDVRKGTKPLARSTPRPTRAPSKRATPDRARSARRVHIAWRDHKRLLTVSGIVVALLLVVGVGGYLLSLYNPAIATITEGRLSLPVTAGVFQRDPAQGATPSVDPASKIQTVSATYSLNGNQQFVAIAFRPQTDPSAALTEIQASGIVKVNGGACGRSPDQNRMACAVVSGTTAVMLVTLVDQTTDELIAAAQSVSDGIGKT